MGVYIDPGKLTESGEYCLARLSTLARLGLPEAQLVTSVMTVVEIHVSRILARLVVLSDVQASLVGSALVDAYRDEMNRTWEARMTWLAKGFDLALAGKTEYQRLDLLTELRNAIVHGDGRLTDYQTKKLTRVIALQKNLSNHLDVRASGALKYGPQAALLVEEAVRKFVAFFDASVIEKYPAARRL